MHRDIPVFNRPIMEKIYQKNQEKHLQRLKNIKSSIKHKAMSTTTHPICNRKTSLLEEQKKTEIEKHNVLLFNKMMRIMKRNDPVNRPQQIYSSHKPRNSVNLSRISQENKSLFQRLQQQKPTISNKKLMEDRIKNLNILKFLGKYPNPLATKYSTKVEERKKQTQQSSQRDLEEQMEQEDFDQYNDYFRNLKSKQTSVSVNKTRLNSQNFQHNRKQQQQSIIKQQKEQSSINNKLPAIPLYKGQHLLNSNPMKIQIFRHYNQYQIIANYINTSTKLTLKIPQFQGSQFFEQYDYNYKEISQMLVIDNGNLAINERKLYQKQQLKQQLKYIPISVNNDQINKKINMGEHWGMYEQALEQFIE